MNELNCTMDNQQILSRQGFKVFEPPHLSLSHSNFMRPIFFYFNNWIQQQQIQSFLQLAQHGPQKKMWQKKSLLELC